MRRYTKEEMNEILRLAADQGRAPGEGGGDYSLEEIQRVAAEVGLEPARIRAAARELDHRGAQTAFSKSFYDTFTLPIESELTTAGWESIVARLRQEFGVPGVIREGAEGSLEWTGMNNSNTYIAVLNRNARRLTFSSDRRGTQAAVLTVTVALAFLAFLVVVVPFLRGAGSVTFLLPLFAALLASWMIIRGGLISADTAGRRRTITLRAAMAEIIDRDEPASAHSLSDLGGQNDVVQAATD